MNKLTKTWFPVVFALVMLVGGAWLVVTGKWLDTSATLFSGVDGVNRTTAQALYRQSMADLADKNFVQAVKGFKQLGVVYPGLQPVIALHLAEACQGIPDERQAQLALKEALDRQPPALLSMRLLYELASSDFRAKEYAQARERFETLQHTIAQLPALLPQSQDWHIAAHYYLGLIGLEQAAGLTRQQGITHLSQYLRQSPQGRYASFAALALAKVLPHPTAAQQQLIGVGLANNPTYAAEAVNRLAPLPKTHTWLAFARAQAQAQQPALAVKTVLDYYPLAKSRSDAEAALALLAAHGKPLKPLLRTLTRHVSPRGDMALWELADAGASNDLELYRQIVRQYPQGDYAPESSWRLLWAKRHDPVAFIEAAEAHEQLFPGSRSYPRVLFWRAKMLERLHRLNNAIPAYQRLADQFSTHYYGYRAQARLADLSRQGVDKQWTLTRTVSFPTAPLEMPMPDVLKTHPMAAGIRELVDIGQPQDACLLTDASVNSDPQETEQVKAWIYWRTGMAVQALKPLRQHIEATQQEGKPVDPAVLRMAYPLKYVDLIGRFARETHVDPYLAASLMREESSFNPGAVSPSNAYGLMQLLLPTANEQVDPQDRPLQAQQLFDPRLNIKAGVRYIAWLFNYTPLQGNARNVVAAYNAGPGQVSGWLSLPENDPDAWVESLPAEETRDYIRRVFTSYWTYTRLYGQ